VSSPATPPYDGGPVLLRSGRVAGAGPEASAVAVVDGRIRAVGTDAFARAAVDGAPEIDLDGALVTPAFVDAHLHTVQAGQVMLGLDLHGVPSRDELLAQVERRVRDRPDSRVVVGQGWDDRYWPDPTPPTRAELDRAGGGAAVYLARVDVHSAVVSSALLDAVPGATELSGYRADGWLTQDAHHHVRGRMDTLFSDAERRTAARTALSECARLGVGTVHDLGGPHLGPVDDLGRVRDEAADLGLAVVGYWGALAEPATLALARTSGFRGLAGDLCIDGAIGSRTAALRAPYSDHDSRGVRYLDDDTITEHWVRCTEAGLQGGFHCIGDDAVEAAVAGLRRAAERLGGAAVRAAHHRLEHVEMVTPEQAQTLAELGVTASVQPGFDAAWGGPGELYEQRLGARHTTMNPFGDLHRAGVRLAFGTDAPVTAIAGWAMVRDAVRHWRSDQRLDVTTAMAAVTVGGHRAAGEEGGGWARGATASLAVWELEAGTADAHGLPRLAPDQPLPRCTGLMVAGRMVAVPGERSLAEAARPAE
jgi:predicted amidohydrolase YtcJ